MIQKEFANKAVQILRDDENVTGLAAGGSWITNEIDEYSDLDLILVTHDKISPDKNKMVDYATRLGKLLSAFTGEHVGEPRLLICLYDDPLLHVDIKFLTLKEFEQRIETPVILLDKGDTLKSILRQTEAKFPYPDYQWIEDRFWVWIHYMLTKISRGEYFEAIESLSFLRQMVLGPLLHIKNGNLPRGVRRAEFLLQEKDVESIKNTIAFYSKDSILESLQQAVSLYRHLRNELFATNIVLHADAEQRVMKYFKEVNQY
ncbi:MAG TPA: aminoglycoside 6-adenylyltransferase [Chitinophagaceae bacterium]|nr:aminoglycoside 6-adenylyltransferase [Chitinophagaceae bacterium]